MRQHARVVVVTGLSGAGKSTALHVLEDLGYFCVDNLPTSLVEHSIDVCEAGGIFKVALGIDVRVGSFLDGATEAFDRLRAGSRDVTVLYIDASDEALLRRFNETRRPHPLSGSAPALTSAAASATGPGSGRTLAVVDGIHLERERLASLRTRADLILDTTHMSVHELRREVVARLGLTSAEPQMRTRFMSFGFKYGVPMDADLVFDVRFLDNPYFVAELRALPGTDPRIIRYVLDNPETSEFIRRLTELLRYCFPRYAREGKSYLTVAIGCTGGRHRSVVLAEHLASLLGADLGPEFARALQIVHRDIDRARTAEAPVSESKPTPDRSTGKGRGRA
jgi:UPF0042 nucleotide-binding protein